MEIFENFFENFKGVLLSILKYIANILKCLGLVYNTEYVGYFSLSEDEGGKKYQRDFNPIY